MANPFFEKVYAFAERTTARGTDVADEFSGVEAGFDGVLVEAKRAIKMPSGADVELPTLASQRIGGVIGFDGNGDVEVQAGVGSFKGDYTPATYSIRDIVKDSAGVVGLNNLYIANETHTSTALTTDIAKWDLLVDVSEVESNAAAALASAGTATTQAGIATVKAGEVSASQVAAGLSETNASNSEVAAGLSEAAAGVSETNTANSEVAAGLSETAAGASETNSEGSNLASSASASSSENSKAYAEEWANKAEDALISAAAGGNNVDDYSARHWKEKAEDIVVGAIINDASTDTSKVWSASKADAVQTGLQSGIDAKQSIYTWVEKTAAYTLVDGDAILADTSGGAFSITLPAAPVIGEKIKIKDKAPSFASFPLTLDRNGQLIMELAEDMTCGNDYDEFTAEFIGGTTGWLISGLT